MSSFVASGWARLAHDSGARVATRAAMGTEIRVVVAEPSALPAAEAVVDAVVEVLERVTSRFRPDSELSRLNALAADGGRFLLSPELREHLAAALAGARWSAGLLDPTIGGALVAAGYDRDLDSIAPEDPRPAAAARPAPGWRTARLCGSLLELDAGTRLDLGSTAKALGADRAAELVAARCGCAALVGFGGDLAVAPSGAASWPVRVEEDAEAVPPAPSQVVLVRRGGVATSSTTRRRWRRAGVACHHLIDPATGAPAEGPYRTVSVAASSCLEANVASAAAVVAGEGAPALLERSGLPARLVDARGEAHLLGGWPALERAPLPTSIRPFLSPAGPGARGWPS